MFGDALKGAGYLLRGVSLLTAPGVKRFVIIPLAINILLFAVLIWLGYNEFIALLDWMMPGEDSWFAGWLDWPFRVAAVFCAVAALEEIAITLLIHHEHVDVRTVWAALKYNKEDD